MYVYTLYATFYSAPQISKFQFFTLDSVFLSVPQIGETQSTFPKFTSISSDNQNCSRAPLKNVSFLLLSFFSS